MRLFAIRLNDGYWYGGLQRGWVASQRDAMRFTESQVEADLGRPMPQRSCGPDAMWIEIGGQSPADTDDEPVPYSVRPSVYLAASLAQKSVAAAYARGLEAVGVLVTSTWHDSDASPKLESTLTDSQRATVAEKCLAEIDAAETFVWLHGHARGRIGAIVEYGYALGKGKDTYLVPLDGWELGTVFASLSPTEPWRRVVEALSRSVV